MSVQNTPRLARIGSPGSGVSIAAVFGVEWIFDLAYSAHNAALEAWKSCLRLWSAEFKRCIICDDELWLGDLVSCSNGTYIYQLSFINTDYQAFEQTEIDIGTA
jgi:hypothetical protein